MNANQVRQLVLEQIDHQWEERNAHGVDLRSSLVTPRRATMIHRRVHEGKVTDSLADVWIVLEELPDGGGYVIFYDQERDEFGLASDGFPEDQYRVISGYYGDFWTAFRAM